jgi:hypothetical protein
MHPVPDVVHGPQARFHPVKKKDAMTGIFMAPCQFYNG